MDRGKDLFKRGWHPEPEGTTLRSQVSGLVGRNKKTEAAKNDHVARPLTSLKDPSQFAPPPKNVNYHGDAASPSSATSERRGLGAASTPPAAPRRQGTNQSEELAEPEHPPSPYRVDRTGLSTAGLPPPPKPIPRGDDAGSGPVIKPKPKLPPRLPPRQNSASSPSTTSPPPPYTETAPTPGNAHGSLRQTATGRLGQAGIAVPGLGIHRSAAERTESSSPVAREANPWQRQQSQTSGGSSLKGLRNQFSGLSTTSSSAPADGATPRASEGGGTTWAQKQAALSTASQLQRDPSKVNAADAKQAVGTAKDFQQRHGDEVAKGYKFGQGLNQKYGIANKVSAYTGNAERSTNEPQPQPDTSTTGIAGAEPHNPWAGQVSAFKKAPPPPPPARRPTDPSTGAKSPPPVPLGSKPR